MVGNENGQLGLGHHEDVTVPKEIVTPKRQSLTLTNVRSDGHSTLLTYEKGREKKLFACGDNQFGKLGLGHSNAVTVPTVIPTPEAAEGYTLTDVQHRHWSIFLTYEKGEKKFFAYGDNQFAQLGLGHNETVLVPEEVKLGSQLPYCLLMDVAINEQDPVVKEEVNAVKERVCDVPSSYYQTIVGLVIGVYRALVSYACLILSFCSQHIGSLFSFNTSFGNGPTELNKCFI